MGDRLIIAPQWVREEWDAMQVWDDSRAQREAQRLQREQPFVLVYVLATLEDEGAEALTLGFELAHAIDGAYRRALGTQPTPIDERVMEQATEETMAHFADLAEAEPELAYRRMMFGRELAVPAVLTECLKILFEVSADVPEIEAALGALFISTMAIAKAYERVHGMAAADTPKSSLAESIERETGQPIPKLGRNEPCPCGSGKKFKKCCGQRTTL